MMCVKSEEKRCLSLLSSSLPKLKDNERTNENHKIAQSILEAMSDGLISSFKEIVRYCKCSLYNTNDNEDNSKEIRALEYLINNGFIYKNKTDQMSDEDSNFELNMLGNATVQSGFTPEDGKLLYDEINMYEKKLNQTIWCIYLLSGVLHTFDINYGTFKKLLSGLRSDEVELANELNITEDGIPFYEKYYSNEEPTSNEVKYKRFFYTLMINDIINETDLYTISQKYRIGSSLH